jgi:N-methylhydantoinase A
VLCAEGLLAADLKAEFSRTLPKAGAIDVPLAESMLDELAAQATAWFDVEGVASRDRRLSRMALLHYRGQGQELAVPWTGTVEGTEANFTEAHRALYGFVLATPIELVTLRVEATGVAGGLPVATLAEGFEIKPVAHAAVSFASGVVDTPIVERASLGAGAKIAGPMILTQLDATTLVLPGWSGVVHVSGALLLTREKAA